MKNYLKIFFAITLLLLLVSSKSYGVVGISLVKHCSNTSSCDGKIEATATGTAGPFKYKWSNGSTQSTITNLCTGGYSLTITADTKCEFVFFVLIGNCQNIGIAPMVNGTVAHILQPGSSTGGVAVSTSGTASNLTFIWRNQNGAIVSLKKDLTYVPKGNYCLEVSSGCPFNSTTKCFEIKECGQSNVVLDLKIDNDDVTPMNCSPGVHAGGAIDLHVKSDFPINQYSWSGPGGFTAQTEDLAVLNGDGTYTVTVTDVCGKAATTSQYIECCNLRALPTALAINKCLGYDGIFGWVTSPGTFTVSTFGLPDSKKWCSDEFEINWDDKLGGGTSFYNDLTNQWTGASSFNIPSSAGGEYCVTVTNSCGCVKASCASFGGGTGPGNPQTVKGYAASTLSEAIDDMFHTPGIPYSDPVWDPYMPIAVGCYNCRACGLPPNIGEYVFGPSGCKESSVTSSGFSYHNDGTGVPCQGGSMTCAAAPLGTGDWTVIPGYTGTPIYNPDAPSNPVPGRPGYCSVPTMCLFPPGTVDNFDFSVPVVVRDPLGWVFPCDVPPDIPPLENCPFTYPAPEGYDENCTIRYYCLTGELAEIRTEYSLIQECECNHPYNLDACYVIKRCLANYTTHGEPDICRGFEVVSMNDCTLLTENQCRQFAKPARGRNNDLEKSNPQNQRFVKIYPNPFTNEISVELDQLHSKEVKDFSIQLFDLFGKMVYSVDKPFSNSSLVQKVDLNSVDLPLGAYIIHVSNKKDINHNFRVIKAN